MITEKSRYLENQGIDAEVKHIESSNISMPGLLIT